MNDVSLQRLIKRCQEKEKQGYDYVKPIEKIHKRNKVYYYRKYKRYFKGFEYVYRYRVVMIKTY